MRLFLLLLLILHMTIAYSQKSSYTDESFYAVDKNGKGTSLGNAAYLWHNYKINDTCWHWNIYNIYGPLIRVERYKDKDGSVAHGKFIFYNKKGTVDSAMEFVNGLAHGDAWINNDTGLTIIHKKYVDGVLTETIDLLKKSEEERLKGKPSDTTGEVESEFTGGVGAWQRYLNKNFQYPQRALQNNIQGTVKVFFIVDTAGNISNIEVFQSVEYSLDEETIRLIRESPKWKPAFQKGRLVKSYKVQPVTFRTR
jgi:periplasmic protein TonB